MLDLHSLLFIVWILWQAVFFVLKALWWLILCVNLTGPWIPIWSNLILGVSLVGEGCFYILLKSCEKAPIRAMK